MRILIADDSPIQLRLLEASLTNWGHEVLQASDGEQAIQIFNENPDIQLLLLDWMMPGLTGPDICRQIRERELPQYVYMVLITALEEKEAFMEGMDSGADDFITKPFDRDKLRMRLHAAERMLGLHSNLALQEKLNEELLQIDRLKNAFMGLTSHELRTPLTSVSGFLCLLEMQAKKEGGDQLKIIQTMEKSVDRLNRIIERTLQVVHGKNFERQLEMQSLTPQKILESVLQELEPFAKLRSIEIRHHLEEGLPELLVEPDKMHDALANLVKNAIKFSPDQSPIDINVTKAGQDYIEFSVTDKGTGIDPEDQPHIFEEFFSTMKIEHHSTGEYEFGKRGIGLGLPIAKSFVELHHGKIGFESEPGQGSRFWFQLPV